MNSSFSYYYFLVKKGCFSWRSLFQALNYFVRFAFLNLSPNNLHFLVFEKFLKGRHFLDVFGHVEDFLDQYFLHFLNPTILKEIDKAKKQQSFVFVLSNSPNYLVQQIVKRLNISGFKATSYGLDINNCLNSIHQLMDGKAKARYALDLARSLDISEKNISVYTDSIWDLPLLQIAGKKIAVSPDRGLCKIAHQRAWKIL